MSEHEAFAKAASGMYEAIKNMDEFALIWITLAVWATYEEKFNDRFA